jgi:hypothetical protein
VIYTDIPDVAGEKDYEAFILSIRLILDFKWPIVIGVWPWHEDNILFQ